MTLTFNEISSSQEKEAFKKYFETYYDSIRSFLYYKTGDIELSDDLNQEVFLKLWEIRNDIKPESVKSLLYTIATNLIRNHAKHQKVVYNFAVNKDQSDKYSEAADFNLIQSEFRAKLQKVLAEVPEKCRIVFLMNRIDGLTYNEIAERLKLSNKAVEKRMHQALSIIKDKLHYKI
jgi:RNA polymerase sigma-70 factor (ECF subfamily)